MKLLPLVALGLASLLVGGCAVQVSASQIPMLQMMKNPEPGALKK
jgi:hypothetical protein